ncbi:MAG TPA: tRNA (N6-threonylcarbamoyladenosine(37)-N6)-methyltransferase TrmO [Nitrospirota bacterium]|nr:tRNA (N6-threonylcarbamoyladenosine(37)-N6)-methyltransferase TrmO [Nitrospirota bacterium]
MKKSVFSYTPIGLLRTPYTTPESIPKLMGRPPVAEGVIELDPAYEECLLDIEGFSHLLVILAFHLSKNKPLRVTPPGQSKERGVFATRSPHRPNAIGILTVELLSRQGTNLRIRGVDVVDGTPILDIKPYLRHFDCRPEAGMGWIGEP